jgi:hypothetical protein
VKIMIEWFQRENTTIVPRLRSGALGPILAVGLALFGLTLGLIGRPLLSLFVIGGCVAAYRILKAMWIRAAVNPEANVISNGEVLMSVLIMSTAVTCMIAFGDL